MRHFSTGAVRNDDRFKYKASEHPFPVDLPIYQVYDDKYKWVDYHEAERPLDYGLLPYSTIVGLLVHLAIGAKSYGRNNWKQGIPLSSYYNSASRHLMQWWAGANDEPHLYSAFTNIMMALWTEREIAKGRLPKELDDRII